MCRLWSPRRLLVLLLLAALVPAAPGAHADDPTGVVVVIDWPGNGAAVVSPVTLIGWALDPEGGPGTGVDGVEVYLDGPAGSGTPLGRPAYGLIRPDVALARGDGRYAPSGWVLQADVPVGVRLLYLYAHLADRPEDEGWVGPWQIMLQIDGGPAVAGPVGREAPPLSAIGGGAGCLDREPSSGRCPTSGGSNQGNCLVPDRDSGRCLLRHTVGAAGTGDPAAHAIPGTWMGLGLANSSAASLGGGVGGVGGAAGAPGAGSANSGLGALAGASGGAGPPTGGTAGPFGVAAGTRGSTGSTPSGAGGAGGPVPPSPSPGASAGNSANTPAINLTAAQARGGQVQLSWNPVGQGAWVNYEVRRCPALLTPALSCTVVATVQSGSYLVVPGGGVYVVRALGPLGQFQGESNRVQLAAGGRQ